MCLCPVCQCAALALVGASALLWPGSGRGLLRGLFARGRGVAVRPRAVTRRGFSPFSGVLVGAGGRCVPFGSLFLI